MTQKLIAGVLRSVTRPVVRMPFRTIPHGEGGSWKFEAKPQATGDHFPTRLHYLHQNELTAGRNILLGQAMIDAFMLGIHHYRFTVLESVVITGVTTGIATKKDQRAGRRALPVYATLADDRMIEERKAIEGLLDLPRDTKFPDGVRLGNLVLAAEVRSDDAREEFAAHVDEVVNLGRLQVDMQRVENLENR